MPRRGEIVIWSRVRMKTGWVVVTLMLLLAIPLADAAETGGRITFDTTSHDFGKVLYGDKVTHVFVVTNSGDETLTISKVAVSCGCTQVLKWSNEIAPKGKGEIVVEFDTEGQRSGKKEQNLYVHSSDPSSPENGFKLSLLGDVVRELEVDPPTFARKLQKFQETLTVPFKITNSSDTPRAITGITSTEGRVTASLEPEKLTVAPNTTVPFNMVLHLKQNRQQPLYLGKILLETDHPREKHVDVRFLIQISEP
jgi:hypothetical protein